MTWEQILPLLPAGLIPAVILFVAQHLGYWGSSRELALLRERIVEEKANTKEWKDKFFELMRQGEINTEALREAVETLKESNQIVKQVTK